MRLFHSGQMFEGVWSKEHDRAKTEYRLPDGSSLPFKQGKVWVHIVPTDFAYSAAANLEGSAPAPYRKRGRAPEDRRIGGGDRPGGSGRTRCRGGRR